jgi:hypothetical protein
MNLAAETKVMIAPNAHSREVSQELHGLVHLLTVIENVSEHDERIDPSCTEFVHGRTQLVGGLVDVGQKSQSHDAYPAGITSITTIPVFCPVST